MNLVKDDVSPSTSIHDVSSKLRQKGSSLSRVNTKALTKGVKQFFGNQKEPGPQNNGAQGTSEPRTGNKSASLPRSYAEMPVDEHPAGAPNATGLPPVAPPSRHRRFIPKSRRKGPAPAEEPAEEGNPWARLEVQRRPFAEHEPLVTPGVTPAPSPRHSPPPLPMKSHSKSTIDTFLGMEVAPSDGTDIAAKAKAKPRADDGPRFSLYGKLTKIRSAKKDKSAPGGHTARAQATAEEILLGVQCSVCRLCFGPLSISKRAQPATFPSAPEGPQGRDWPPSSPRAKKRLHLSPRLRFPRTMVHRFGLRRRCMSNRAEPPDGANPLGSASPQTSSVEELPDLDGPELAEEEAQLETLRGEQALLQQKVLRVAEQIRVQQMGHDANVSQYLRLVANADRGQAHRFKQAFEKKNQALASVITQLQRRLAQHIKRHQDLDRAISLLQTGDLTSLAIQRYSQAGNDALLDGLSVISSDTTILRSNMHDVASPKAPSDSQHEDDFKGSLRLTDDPFSLFTSFPEDLQEIIGLSFSDSKARRDSLERQNVNFLPVLEELSEIKETQISLELKFKQMAEQYNQDYRTFGESLNEEKYRSQQLQTQLNDLIDLHQNEILNLKSELASLEEKIAYQSYESSRDIWEVLETFQTKMGRLEHVQQVVQGEMLDHGRTRELLGKSANVLLMLFAVVLMLMSTIHALTLPFVRTRARLVASALALGMLVVAWYDSGFVWVLFARGSGGADSGGRERRGSYPTEGPIGRAP
uniref:transmembrane and coiled-coil domains protein 1-like n=1 Tax=Pristiophorus japonicus TaxID=55135 RepID=UPI00398F8D4E